MEKATVPSFIREAAEEGNRLTLLLGQLKKQNKDTRRKGERQTEQLQACEQELKKIEQITKEEEGKKKHLEEK